MAILLNLVKKRRRKYWVCRTRSQRAASAGLYPHTPVLMDWVVDVFTHKRQLPHITRLQHVESLGAQVPRPSLDELIEKRVL